MSVKQLWLNLPVSDLKKSIDFYTGLGFVEMQGMAKTEYSRGFQVGENKLVVMLFQDTVFENFVAGDVANAKNGVTVLMSIDAESPEEVDEFAANAVKFGGAVYGEPSQAQQGMYGCGIEDPDGHKWNMLFMN